MPWRPPTLDGMLDVCAVRRAVMIVWRVLVCSGFKFRVVARDLEGTHCAIAIGRGA